MQATASGIRKALLEMGPATKAELSERLGISFPTTSKLLAHMEQDGEVFSAGLDQSSGGRRAARYAYNPEYMLGLSVFLEKAETHYIVFNCLGEVKEQRKAPSVLEEGNVALTRFIESVMDAHPARIKALAIGVPGAVENGQIFYMPGYESFQGFDAKSYYEDHFAMPVVVENDMNAAVLGYYHNRGIEAHQSLVYLYAGQNGPGAGLMVNGDVVRGSSLFAGEVSFVPQYEDRNFGQALEQRGGSDAAARIDALSRMVATYAAILNPHTIIFYNDEMEIGTVAQIAKGSSRYIPSEHLPKLTISDWKQDYLYGLRKLCLDLIIQFGE